MNGDGAGGRELPGVEVLPIIERGERRRGLRVVVGSHHH